MGPASRAMQAVAAFPVFDLGLAVAVRMLSGAQDVGRRRAEFSL